MINATQLSRPPREGDLSHALDEMLSDAEVLTRTLLGGQSYRDDEGTDDSGDEDGPGARHPAVLGRAALRARAGGRGQCP